MVGKGCMAASGISSRVRINPFGSCDVMVLSSGGDKVTFPAEREMFGARSSMCEMCIWFGVP